MRISYNTPSSLRILIWSGGLLSKFRCIKKFRDPVDPGGTNLVTKCKLSEGYCVIPNKSAYLYGDTWEKVVKVVAPVIIKTNVSNVACVLPI